LVIDEVCEEGSCAAHKPIKVFFLPERLADAAQQFVRPTGGWSLGTMHQLREPDMGRPKHMYVIGRAAAERLTGGRDLFSYQFELGSFALDAEA